MPANPTQIVGILSHNGFTALKVGGCVRDTLLGLSPKDIDIATNASPDQVEAIFRSHGYHVDLVGKNFGVCIVGGVELASFRSEVYNVRGKPTVAPAATFLEDSSRRDFTINAMGLTADGELIDHHNGSSDLRNRTIRCVGNACDRFNEDPSRILRGIELAARLDFDLHPSTLQAMRTMAVLLAEVPNPLKGKIIKKAILANKLSVFLRLLHSTGTLPFVFPELVHTFGCLQNPTYHQYDVFTHTLVVLRSAEKLGNATLVTASLLHDVAKGVPGIRGVNTQGLPNDLGHEEAGVPIAKGVLQRYEFDKATIQNVLFLVNFHGIQLEPNPKPSACLRILRRMAPYYRTKTELYQAVNALYDFKKCDADGFSESFGREVKKSLPGIREALLHTLNTSVIYIHDLKITGRDLMARGIQGKQIGELLNRFLELNFTTEAQIRSYLKRHYPHPSDRG